MGNDGVKFIQLVVAPWEGDNGRATYSMFALGDDGRVYRQERAAGAWRKVGSRILTSAAAKELDKKKYGASYIEREVSDDK